MLNRNTYTSTSQRKTLSPILSVAGTIVLILSLGSLGACSSSSGTASAPAESKAPFVPVEVKKAPTWPLTGLPNNDDPAAQSRAALSVKVENSQAARPQSGLEDADIVWVEMIEGGATRYNAVFQSRLPAEIGPMRSVRPMDVGISAPLEGLLVYSGGIKDFENAVKRAGIHGFNEDQSIKANYRSKKRRMPHNLYLKPAEMLAKYGSELKAPPAQFDFVPSYLPGASPADAQAAEAKYRAENEAKKTDDAKKTEENGSEKAGEGAGTDLEISAPQPGVDAPSADGGKPSTQVVVKYPGARSGWSWSGATWLRYDDGKQSLSASGTPLSAENLLIMQVGIHPTPYRDPAGATVMETEMTGGGDGWVLADGKALPVKWAKDTNSSPVVLTTADGKPVLLKPGNLWIELAPANTVTIS